MRDCSDQELIAAVARDGDKSAFEELVRRYQSPLRASMRKLTNGNFALADDVAQEAFILAWKNIGQFRADAKFSTWLYRIGFNAWQTQVRKKSEFLHDDLDRPHEETDPAPTPNHTEQVGMRRDIDRAMTCLSESEKNAIVHCYYQDLSHEEAAYVLGLPLGTLKTHVLKAKAKMRTYLLDYAGAPT